jgi:CHAT domain-containing protein
LSLDPEHSATPQALTIQEVAMLQVPDSLVILSGCKSAVGDAQPGAGLLGMVRAWLTAGAAGVIATYWAMPDSTGELFPPFYRHLAQVPPAQALHLAQREMIASHSWRSAPAYWAAYQFTGGTR